MDISFAELESMPRDEFRALNMPEVVRRIALIVDPTTVSIESEIVGNYVRVTATQAAPRFIDLLTGEIL